MMGLSPRCYIPSFMEVGQPVPGKKIFKGFYHIGACKTSKKPCRNDAAVFDVSRP